MPESNSGGTTLATQDDIKDVLGDINPAEMLAIVSLRPTIGWKAIRMCSAPARQYKASRQKLSQSSRRMKKRSHAQNSCATSALRSERGCP